MKCLTKIMGEKQEINFIKCDYDFLEIDENKKKNETNNNNLKSSNIHINEKETINNENTAKTSTNIDNKIYIHKNYKIFSHYLIT